MSMDYISQLKDMSVGCIWSCKRCRHLEKKMKDYGKQLNQRLTEEGFKNYSPQKIKYYTGLPSLATFMVLFNFIAPHVGDNSQSNLPLFQQFIMVLVKLWTWVISTSHIGLVFTISRYFIKCINVMYVKRKPLIKWPEHGENHACAI